MNITPIKEICYYGCPNMMAVESSVLLDGSQIYNQDGYLWYKLVHLWFAQGTGITNSDITDMVQNEFYPNTDYQRDQEPNFRPEVDGLGIVHVQVQGQKVMEVGPDLNGSLPYYYLISPYRVQKTIQHSLGVGQSIQNMGWENMVYYKIEAAQADQEGSSDISKLINQLFYPATNFIFMGMQFMHTVQTFIGKQLTGFGKFDGLAMGRYASNV